VRLRGDRGHTRKTARRRETHRSARKPFAAAVSSVCSISARPRQLRVRSTGKTGNSSWVYVWKLRDGEITGYDQFNDAGLAAAFA
jgi:ketosteroid isomerase-like protein